MLAIYFSMGFSLILQSQRKLSENQKKSSEKQTRPIQKRQIKAFSKKIATPQKGRYGFDVFHFNLSLLARY